MNENMLNLKNDSNRSVIKKIKKIFPRNKDTRPIPYIRQFSFKEYESFFDSLENDDERKLFCIRMKIISEEIISQGLLAVAIGLLSVFFVLYQLFLQTVSEITDLEIYVALLMFLIIAIFLATVFTLIWGVVDSKNKSKARVLLLMVQDDLSKKKEKEMNDRIISMAEEEFAKENKKRKVKNVNIVLQKNKIKRLNIKYEE